MVLTLAHILHVGGLLLELRVVEELASVKCALLVVLFPLADRLVHVKAEAIATAHGINELLADKLSDILIRLVVQGDLDDLGSHLSELTLVVHEGANAALLVPDEEVLAGLMSIIDG